MLCRYIYCLFKFKAQATMKYSKLPAERYGKWIFGNRYNRALWCPPIISKMVTNNAFYRISVLVSSLFIADVSPAHISAQHQSGQIKSKHIHILISNSCSNCKFLAGGTWQRRAGAGDCKWCMESAGRSWNRVTDNILGFLGLSSLECAHFCSCFPPSLFRQQSVSGSWVFVQAETRYIYTMCSACAWCHCR